MTPYSDSTIVGYLIAAHEHIMGERVGRDDGVASRVLFGTTGLI
jgi:hypothetical protein